MYYEVFENIYDAINREKSLKGKTRKKKNVLISSSNSLWKDLSNEIVWLTFFRVKILPFGQDDNTIEVPISGKS